MKDKRIGNDISVVWTLMRDGAPFNISGLPVTLYLRNMYGKTEIEDFTVSKNQVNWTFYGKDQKQTGKYSLVLVVNEDKEGMLTTDACDFVNLVSCSCKVGNGADECGVQTETIELTSTIEYVAGCGTISIEIDSELSEESTNPVENRVITGELAKKVNKSDLATINGQRIDEGGNIEIEGGGSTPDLSGYLTKEEFNKASEDFATTDALEGKQDTIEDLNSIRSGAEKGATAVQPSILENYATTQQLTELSADVGKKVDADKVATINGQSLVQGGNITIVGGEKGEKGDKGDKGDQGNSGYTGAADELEVVNNLTQGGATAALSAEMGKVLSAEISESRSIVTNNFFVGKDNTYSSTKIYGLLPNSTYRIYFPKDYEFPQGAPGDKLYIGYYIGTADYKLMSVKSTLEPYYDITTPSEFDYLEIGGRTTQGVKVWFSIHYYNDVIALTEEINNNASEIKKVESSITSTILFGQKANYKEDFGLNPTGGEEEMVGYNYITEYIPVKSTDTVLWRFGDVPKSRASLIIYDADKNYLNYYGGQSKTRTIKLSAYPTAEYIRVSFYPTFDGERNASPISVSGKDFYLVEEIKGQKDAGLTEFGKIGEYYPNEIADVEGPLNYSEWVSNRLHFIHTSDNHGGDFGYADEYLDLSPAKFLVNTGDIVVDKFADKDNSQTITLATSTAKPCYIVLGNHDYSRATSKQDVYNAFMLPTHAHNGIDSDKTYYSVDYSEEKVKCIMLDIADGYEDSEYANLGPTPLTTGNMSEEQISWLFTQLEDALANDFHVCIFSHVPPKDIDRERTISEFSDIGKLDGKCYNLAFLVEVVDAFINGESVSFAYKDKDYSHDFSNGGHFVAWFFGHMHYDECGWMKDHPNQFLVGVCRPRGGYVGFGSYDGEGLGVHFNYVTVDTSVKSLAVYRIGQQETIYATSRKSFRILYK